MSEITPVLTSANVLRDKIHEKTKAALRSVFPLDLKGRTLEIEDVVVHNKTFSPTQQRQALLTGSSLSEAVKGTLILKGADGKVIDTAKNFTLAHIPHLTERHTLISDGNEYQIANQLRRKPGVYTQRADNGELRTVFNLGRGQNFDLGFNEAKGTFQVQYGTTNLPLYGVLRGLGATHDQIAAQWGAGVAKANEAEHGHQIESTVAKLYGKLEHPALVKADATHDERVAVIQKRYGMTTLDPEVTKLTLGHGHESVTPKALLDASAKMLRVHKGEELVDDTDSLAFKTFHSMDDFLAERIRLTARAWAPKAKRALQGKSVIRDALHTAPFSESIRKFVTTSSLSAVPTGINPMELIDHAVKVTSLGEGGIPSDRAIPMDARMIHNTHFGALDPIRTPESSHSGVDIRASIAAHRDDKGNLYTALRNVKTNKMELLRAGDQRHYVVAFPHQDLKGDVDAFVKGNLEKIDAKHVTHQLDHLEHVYSPATTLVPFRQSMQGNRAIMASKFGTQALPLVDREVPWVQVRSHLGDGSSFEEVYGHMIVPVASVKGTVKKVDADYVYIEPSKAVTKKAEARSKLAASTEHLDLTVMHRSEHNADLDYYVALNKTKGVIAHLFMDYKTGKQAAYVTFTPALDGSKSGEVVGFTTHPEFRGLGLGREIWDKVHAAHPDWTFHATPDPFKDKTVSTEDLGKVYQKLGFKPHPTEANRFVRTPDGTKTAGSDAGLVKVPYQTSFPFPSKTHLHHEISVRPGDKVEEGQRLGDSNYTRGGTLALGKNLLVGYMPYYGFNSNDAMVISAGAAKKLTSEHMYREVYPVNSRIELNREKHKLYYGSKYQPAQYAHLDADGVVKKGAKVNPKDILVSGLTKQVVSGSDALVGRISKALTKPYKEVVLEWGHGTPGEVVDVVRTNNQITILVRTLEQMQVGDKLAGRHANKGVVAKIIPDHEMIRDEAGRPLDVLITSAGVISRVNSSQILETVAGKVAEKTGKPIVFDNAAGTNSLQWVRDLAKDHGVKDKEHVYDPILKRTFKGGDGKGVLVGRQYIYKLFKSTDTNFAGHGVGPYDLNEQPLKTGGDDSAKGLGKMEFDALLAHNARNFLNESASVRGTKNDEFWKAVQLGLPMPAAKPSFAFNKFVGMLEGAGVRIDKRGSKFHILPLTDKDVVKRSAGAIENNKTLQAKDLKPEKGGLFDPARTGGPQGTLYSHIDLHEPIPSPVFREPVRRLLGMTEKQFEGALGEHGGGWFKSELDKIDTTQKLKDLREKMKRANGPVLNDLVKQVKYLEALKTHGLKPSEAYIISKVPVIPPVFRPILPGVHDPTQMMVADANKLYAQLMDANHTLKNTALDSDIGKHRNEVFSTVEELYGTTLPRDPKMQQQKVKGFLSSIAGVGTPKGGFFQRKLMRRNMDVSGRGTAVPDVNLGMDEVGIPEAMLWGMLDKLIVARLIRKGYPALQAREMVIAKAPAAREAMLEETRERPVLINRAPTLHRWSIVASYAKPVQGKTIRVSPFIEKGLNLDFDGDQVQNKILVGLNRNPSLKDFDLDASLDPSYKEGVAQWWAAREAGEEMTARIKVQVPMLDGETLHIVDLAEFPHGELAHEQATKAFYAVKGARVLAYDEVLKTWVWAEVASWSVHHGCETLLVTTEMGQQLITDDDPRAVYGFDGESLLPVRRRPADAVEQNTWLLMAHDVSSLEGDMSEFQGPVSALPLSTTIGRWLGTMVGDGWVAADNYVGLAAMNDGIAADWHTGMEEVYPGHTSDVKVYTRDVTEKPEQGFANSRRFVLHDKRLGRWLAPIIGQGAENKHLPPFFLRAPRAFRLGLFAGLMQTDGCISVSNGKKKPQWMINFCTSSNRLAREYTLLCKSLGIRAKITTSDRGAMRLTSYTVTPSSVDLARLGSITVADPEAQADWTRFFKDPPDANAASSGKLDRVPVPDTINYRLRKLVKMGSSQYISLHNAKTTGGVTRSKALEILSEFAYLREDADELLQRWIALVDNAAVRWDRVVSFEKTGIIEDGYDLTVPGYETFMNVEGVILSNTLQVHAPITPGAIDDAKKMTLSNMLLSDQTRNKILAFPQHEAIIGFTLAAKAGAGTGQVKQFGSPAEVRAAWRAGTLKLDDAINVKNMKAAEEPEEVAFDADPDVSLYPAANVLGGADDVE